MKYIKEILLTNKFTFNDNYDYVGFCSELNTYMLVITVPWITYYSRYYWISEEDFNLAKNNLTEFKNKYKEAFNSVKELPKGITFMGSVSLRDYDARPGFHSHISSGTNHSNVFQGFLYEKENNVLYAHILMNGVHYAVLPYRIIQNEKAEYIRPLENNTNAEMVYGNIDGERTTLFMGINVDTFEGFSEWKNEFDSNNFLKKEEKMNRDEMAKELIENKGLPYFEGSKMIPTSKNCSYPSKKYIFNMLTKYYLFATLAATNYDAKDFNFIYSNLNVLYQYDTFFNDSDRILLDKLLKNDTSIDIVKISWLYEECFIFAWMMNLVNFPSQEGENNTNVLNDLLFLKFDEIRRKKIPSKLFVSIYDNENKRLDYEKINLRSFEEILKKADLLKRYLWGIEELRINNQNNNSGLSEKVIRHQLNAFSKALNWDLSNPGV